MSNQQMMSAAFNTIRSVASTTKKNEKVALLKKGDSPYLRQLLFWTYNKYATYRLQELELPAIYNSVTPDVMRLLEELIGTLSAHRVGSLEAKKMVKNLLGFCTREDAEIIANLIRRDLRAGIDEKTANAAFPGLVPVFEIQLGKALDSWDRVSFPIIVDEKIDEIRCVALYNGEGTRFYSRTGFEFTTGMEPFAREISKLLPGVPFMLDAGFRGFKFNPKDKTCVKHKNGNWQFEYASSIARRKEIDPEEIREHFKLYIWDVVDLDYFTTQGRTGECLNTASRKIRLFGMFERHEHCFQNLVMVPSYVMNSRAEIRAYMRELKLLRREGCMLKPMDRPYTFGKNYNVMKLKHFVEGDFRILDAYEGERGTKYQGMLGGVLVGTDDGKLKSNMGSGFSDSERLELWVEHLAGRLARRIVELQLKDVTADGSLQLPTLLRFRDDKDTTDTFEELTAKLSGSGEEE